MYVCVSMCVHVCVYVFVCDRCMHFPVTLFYPSSWLNKILLHIYHNFLLCSPLSGYLGLSHILTIINATGMSTGMHVSLQNPNINLLGLYPGMEVFLRLFHAYFHIHTCGGREFEK